MKEPPHIPLAKLQKLRLESKRKRKRKKNSQKENKKKSQKLLKNSSLAKIFFFFKNIHNYIEQTRTPKCKTRKKHKTHTQRHPQAEMHCLKGELVERESACSRVEREKYYSAPWNLHLSKYSFYGKVSLSVMSNKTVCN